MKKGLILLISAFCMVVLFSASRSFASANLFGAHCWTGVSTRVFIELQFTRSGPLSYYNVNGSVTRSTAPSNVAYGSSFYDEKTNQVKVAYTLVNTNEPPSLNTVIMLLDPNTLNGSKLILPAGMLEEVNLVSCK